MEKNDVKNPVSPSTGTTSQKATDQRRCQSVERAVVRRAVGYQVPLKKTFKVKHTTYDPTTGKKIAEEEVLEMGVEEVHVPGDLRAAAYYLNNRAPDRWREHPVESEGLSRLSGVVILPEMLSPHGDDTTMEEGDES